jgi:hypothetical protein
MGSNPIGGFQQQDVLGSYQLLSLPVRHLARQLQTKLGSPKECVFSFFNQIMAFVDETRLVQATYVGDRADYARFHLQSVTGRFKEFKNSLNGLNTIVYIYPVYKGTWEILEYGVHN